MLLHTFGHMQIIEKNEKMELKVKEGRSFRNNRNYSEEFGEFYKRLKFNLIYVYAINHYCKLICLKLDNQDFNQKKSWQ